MKKFICMFFVLIIIFAMSLSSYAINSNKVVPYCDEWFTEEEVEACELEVESLVKNGYDIINNVKNNATRSSSKNLNISKLYQDHGTWANSLMPCGHSGHTYGNVGCAMTSYSMALNYYGHDTTPDSVAETYQDNHGDCCNFNSSLLVSDYSGRTRTLSSNHSSSDFDDVKAAIVSAIDANRPVVVKLVRSSGSTHFVVCVGYYISSGGNTTIYINDPLYSTGKASLNAYANDSIYPYSYCIIK